MTSFRWISLSLRDCDLPDSACFLSIWTISVHRSFPAIDRPPVLSTSWLVFGYCSFLMLIRFPLLISRLHSLRSKFFSTSHLWRNADGLHHNPVTSHVKWRRNGYLDHDYFLKHRLQQSIRPGDNVRLKDATTGNGMVYQATKMLSTEGGRRLSIQPLVSVPLDLRHSLHVFSFLLSMVQFREYVRFRADQNLQVMDVCGECHLYNAYSFPFMRFRFLPWIWLDILSVPAIISFVFSNKPSLTFMYSGP